MGGRPQLLKQLNQSTVLDVVRTAGPISRADVARSTGLSRPTVSHVVSALLAADLIREIGSGETSVGRKPVLLMFNGDAALVVGVDLGATKMLLGITNLDGQVLAEVQVPTPVQQGVDGVADGLVAAITELISRSGRAMTQVCGIGVGVTGAVDTESGVVLAAAGLGARDWPLRTILEERFGLPVF
ncbi:MAG: hypothetical protein JWN15_250, partial [Firmicutes bacterium]|nr:hypothetical protein [Bacillota bacterium]